MTTIALPAGDTREDLTALFSRTVLSTPNSAARSPLYWRHLGVRSVSAPPVKLMKG